MIQYVGQVPEEVYNLVADWNAKAGHVEGLVAALRAKLGSTTWTGEDRERFEGDWDGQLSPQLRNVAGALHDIATTARGNA